MAVVIFLGEISGKSKKGNDFAMVRLGELSDDGASRVSEHFTDGKLKGIETFNFGDVVKTSWVEGRFMGDKPRLAELTLVRKSPYYQNNEKGEDA